MNNRFDFIVIIFVVFELARSRPAFFGALLEGPVPVDANLAFRRVTRRPEDTFCIREDALIICKKFCPGICDFACLVGVVGPRILVSGVYLAEYGGSLLGLGVSHL